MNTPEHETVLTPADFAAMESLDLDQLENDTEKWYSSAMYNPDLFQGDIANDVSDNLFVLLSYFPLAKLDNDWNVC